MISKSFSLRTHKLVFNMAGSTDAKSIPKSDKVEYADANEVLSFCKSLTPSSILLADYHQ